ncbi:hypothetical protein [uncultured Clostridium sp.]|uniref:hypothetical protein n=1 Tax=uncultured Clostridium sp. TaxID=59620 RepID=UPI00260D3E37|nr:hypothetical protein [uncultured Clostridium sp.]
MKFLKENKVLNEGVQIICDLSNYNPWSGAVDTWNKIVEANKVDAFDSYLSEIYPHGLTMLDINDMLWFCGEQILSNLGIHEDEEDNDDDMDESLNNMLDEALGLK